MVALLLCAVTAMAIIAFSSEEGNDSSVRSYQVARVIARITVEDFDQLKRRQQNLEIMKLQTPVRKGAHMAEYAMFSFCLLVFLRTFNIGRVWCALWTFAMAAAFAATDEYRQSFTAGRVSSATDVGIDTAGALIGIAAAIILMTLIERKMHRKSAQ